MRPRERRETGEQDLFRSRLDQIIDMKHPLVALARTVDWGFLEGRFGEVYTDDPGQASETGAREAGAAGKDTRGGFAPVLCAGGQVRSHPASALCPRQAVQARQSDAEETAD